MKTKLFIISIILFSATGVYAQHEHHQEQKPKYTKPKKEKAKPRENEMDHDKLNPDMDSTEMPPMSHAHFALRLS
jgi:uncharacterized protein YxeA